MNPGGTPSLQFSLLAHVLHKAADGGNIDEESIRSCTRARTFLHLFCNFLHLFATFCIFLHNAKNATAAGNMTPLNLRVTPFYLRAILIIIHQYTRLKTTSPNLRVAPFYLRAILFVMPQYPRLKTSSPNLRVTPFYLRVHFKAYVLLGSVVPPELSTTSFCIRILRRFTTV